MKQVKEIDRASLSMEQKLGMLMCANLNHGPADVDYAVGRISLKPHRIRGANRNDRRRHTADQTTASAQKRKRRQKARRALR